MKSTIVIGHKNPDTDSICSAVCYAYLKHRMTGEEYVPCRAGDVNGETKYVLDRFCVPAPRYIESLEPTVADVPFRRIEGIDAPMSLKRAWEHMRDANIPTVPILTKRKKIRGILTLGDQARFYMEDQDPAALSKAKTPYSNIADTLRGEIVVGDAEAVFSKGKVVVAAANPDLMEEYIEANDMVILGNRSESQLCAIELKASCLIVCLGAKISKYIIEIAEKAGCTIITSPLDTYTAAKLINQSVPVGHLMCKKDIITFNLDDAVADVKATVSKLRIRYFPVLDADGHYVGMISQRNLLDVDKQKVILVDHNEKGQAVDGIRSAEVLEVIDHHRIDSVETTSPIYFRNQPLGCTATIITLMYHENKIEIEPSIAGLLCSAILSDTLMFRSPTCTPVDENTARELAEIAGINVEEHARAMFNAGSKLGRKTPDEIFHIDCKAFKAEPYKITVSQVTSVSRRELERVKEKMLPYMESLLPNSGNDMLFLMLTNIIDQSSDLLFVGQGAKGIVESAFAQEAQEANCIILQGVVSRKKQVLAPLMTAIEANT
ncbi:putative manganese-dependent inorganic diphosphatase [Ruminococcus sp.]|uniref:putative manganese-dependent inorganic diphosphatase n=1 Tax=Ruminococcus sp. TaxID=41978 RepID=UPI00388F4DA4